MLLSVQHDRNDQSYIALGNDMIMDCDFGLDLHARLQTDGFPKGILMEVNSNKQFIIDYQILELI